MTTLALISINKGTETPPAGRAESSVLRFAYL